LRKGPFLIVVLNVVQVAEGGIQILDVFLVVDRLAVRVRPFVLLPARDKLDAVDDKLGVRPDFQFAVYLCYVLDTYSV
jgi:hypothetical protein